MTTFRINKTEKYTVISNTFIKDERLSWRAKGVLTWLLSRPDNWKPMLCDMQKRSRDGRDSTASALKELIEYNYIARSKHRDQEGAFSGYEYEVYETPVYGQPDAVNPDTVIPYPENPTLLSTEKSNILNKQVLTSSKEKKTKINSLLVVFEDFDLSYFTKEEQIAIKEWFDYKKERKDIYQTRGFTALITQLKNQKEKGCNLCDAITGSIAANYKGLIFALGYASKGYQKLLTSAQQSRNDLKESLDSWENRTVKEW